MFIKNDKLQEFHNWRFTDLLMQAVSMYHLYGNMDGKFMALSLHFLAFVIRVRYERNILGYADKNEQILVGVLKSYIMYFSFMDRSIVKDVFKDSSENPKEVMTKVDKYVAHLLKDLVKNDDVTEKLKDKTNTILEDIEMNKSVAWFIYMAVFKYLVQDLMKQYICTQGTEKIYQSRIDWLKRKLADLRSYDPNTGHSIFQKFVNSMKIMNDNAEAALETKIEESVKEFVIVEFASDTKHLKNLKKEKI